MKDDSKNPNPTSPNDASEILKLRAELQSKDEQLALRQRELDALRNGPGSNDWRTTTTKPTWLFRVTPFRKDLPQLRPLEDRFVDESEAIRCFWVQNKGAKGTNKLGAMIELDSTNVFVNCECLEPKREEDRRKQYLAKVPKELVPALN